MVQDYKLFMLKLKTLWILCDADVADAVASVAAVFFHYAKGFKFVLSMCVCKRRTLAKKPYHKS